MRKWPACLVFANHRSWRIAGASYAGGENQDEDKNPEVGMAEHEPTEATTGFHQCKREESDVESRIEY